MHIIKWHWNYALNSWNFLLGKFYVVMHKFYDGLLFLGALKNAAERTESLHVKQLLLRKEK